MTTELLISLILSMSPFFGVEKDVALAVASVESSLDPDARGKAGEIGLFQIMPRVAKAKGFSKVQLEDPVINIYVGLLLLQEAKKTCIHRNKLQYLVCYNYGRRNARKIKSPSSFPYVRKVRKRMKNLKKYYDSLKDTNEKSKEL